MAQVLPQGQVVQGVMQGSLIKVEPQPMVVTVTPDVANSMNGVAFQNLANVNNLEFRQGNVFWEAISGGCVPNSYMIKDRPTDTPLFIMEEQSSCYMRGCCGPAQPALVKFHNVSFGGERQEKKCCCIVLQPKRKMYNKAGAAVMTMEKAGMCGNCAQFGPTNCWVCFSMCQSEAWMHSGDIPSTYSPQGCACFKTQHWEFPNGVPGTMDKSTAFSHAKVPLMGGCLTPTVNIMARANNVEDSQPWAVVEGPTFFGGCMDLCCATKFSVSRNKGKLGDLAIISKKAPNGCMETCVALCTPSDTYNLDFTEGHGMNPQQKAAVIGEMVHLDFLFFEAEQPLCRTSEDGKMCFLLLCTCYCMGALCPVQLCVPTGKK